MIRTDHASLKHLWEQQISIVAQHKWFIKLLGYDFSIEYEQGRANVGADALSRMHDQVTNVVEVQMCNQQQQLQAISMPLPSRLSEINNKHLNIRHIQDLLEQIRAGERDEKWCTRDSLLLYKERIYLEAPSELIPIIVKEFHDGTHEGVLKALKRISAVFHWPRMH